MSNRIDRLNIPERRRLSDREIARRLLRVYEILGLFDAEEPVEEDVQRTAATTDDPAVVDAGASGARDQHPNNERA